MQQNDLDHMICSSYNNFKDDRYKEIRFNGKLFVFKKIDKQFNGKAGMKRKNILKIVVAFNWSIKRISIW